MPERLDGDIDADLVAEPEAVHDDPSGARHTNGHAFDLVLVDAGSERRPGEAHDPNRRNIDRLDCRAPVHRQPDFTRVLRAVGQQLRHSPASGTLLADVDRRASSEEAMRNLNVDSEAGRVDNQLVGTQEHDGQGSPGRLLAAFEVARFIRCHEETVRRAYSRGLLRSQRFGVRRNEISSPKTSSTGFVEAPARRRRDDNQGGGGDWR